MDVKALIGIVVQLSLLLLVLAVGMRSHWNDLLYVFRKPKNLVRALVAVNVVVPCAALILCALLPVEPLTRAGLIIMAVSPLAPFATGKMMKISSDVSYDVGVYSALVLAAVIIVPVTVELLKPLNGLHATIPVAALAWFVVKSVFLPLAAGIAIATFWPAFARRAAPIATIVTYAALIPLSVVFLIKTGAQLQTLIGDGTMVVIVGTIAAALAAGHFLGGRDPGHRAALSQAAATRHPGIAALIAQGDFDRTPRVMTAVLLFLLVGVAMTTMYGLWMRRTLTATQAATREIS